jgi:hypothetical protein
MKPKKAPNKNSGNTTYLSKGALKAVFKLNGIALGCSQCHFEDVNLLGTDDLRAARAQLHCAYGSEGVT